MNGGWGISYEIALRWMPLDFTDVQSTLAQVMAWCCQATSHYLSQCFNQDLCRQMASLGLSELSLSVQSVGGGRGCEVSCGGHHQLFRGKTTTGSALDGAVFDSAQILAHLVHNMSRSQICLGFGHFGWLNFSVNRILVGLWLNFTPL